MPRTKEEALRLGIKIQPIKHSKKRRAVWHDYTRKGMYLLTIHICTDDEGCCYEGMLLSHIVGDPMAEVGTEAYPHPELTELGRLVDYKIDAISTYPQFRDVEVKARTIMPTHVHLIVEVKCDLPYYTNRKRPYHLGDMVRGFKQGCTSLFKRWMKGERADAILASLPSLPSVNGGELGGVEAAGRKGGGMGDARGKGGGVEAAGDAPRTYTTTPGGKSDITLWEDKYNDRVLIDDKAIRAAYEYVEMNAWYWQMETLYPQLFEHALHLTIAGSDYSAYGCMFLLKRPERRQVFCHRLARRGQLTDDEWQKATASWDNIRAFERHARAHKLGHFDRAWYRSNNPSCTTAIDYTRTEAFRKEMAEHLKACDEMGAVLVSPAVSAGEAAICYAALEQGYPVIKLQKDAITSKAHPVNKDRSYCGKGIMLVLGPWVIEDAARPLTVGKGGGAIGAGGDAIGAGGGAAGAGGLYPPLTEGHRGIPTDTLYTKFHNLNAMTAALCMDGIKMSIDKNTLKECNDAAESNRAAENSK